MTPSGAPRPRGVLPRGAEPGPPLRRRVLHRGPHHRDLLPARAARRARPAVGNVTFHATAASAQAAGYRACKRCLPDATPGSPEWDVAADVAGRAMRLIADGRRRPRGGRRARPTGRLHPAAPRPAARPGARRRPARPGPRPSCADRADPDRDHRPAARRRGLRGRVRQRPAVQRHRARGVRRVAEPSCAGAAARRGDGRGDGRVGHAPGRPRRRSPARRLLDFLASHLVPGVEVAGAAAVRPHPRPAARARQVRSSSSDLRAGGVPAFVLRLLARRPARHRRRRRARPPAARPRLRPGRGRRAPRRGPGARRRWCARTPGLRVPGHVDGDEIAVRAVLGQQVSVAGARTVAGAARRRARRPVDRPVPGLTHLFPDAADPGRGRPRDPADAPGPRPRAASGWPRRSPTATSRSTAAPTATTYAARCSRCPGSGRGPRTTSRCGRSAHPDVFLPTDLARPPGAAPPGLRPGGAEPDPDAWRPWRSYALLHVWNTSAAHDPTPTRPR